MENTLSVPVQITDFLPSDLENRLKLPKNVAFKSTIADFLAFSQICEYRIEYHEGFVISFYENIFELMANHERLVRNFLVIIQLFIDQYLPSWEVFPSNLVIYIHLPKPSVYKPDVVVFKEKMEMKTYFDAKNVTQKAYGNPYLFFEVLSESTRNFDLNEKLKNYKNIPSLMQIIFAEQKEFKIVVFEKINENWLKSTYIDPNDVFFVSDCPISLLSLYKKVDFNE